MSFAVASIHQSQMGSRTRPNFPNTNDDSYISGPNDSYIADSNLVGYIEFAYKLQLSADQSRAMVAKVPGWVSTDMYVIRAKAEGNATKDQMRLMVQSLLANRFKLAVHIEKKEAPVIALTLITPGKLGPKLRPHDEGPPCDPPPAADGSTAHNVNVFPPACDIYSMKITPAQTFMEGSRNTTMSLLAGFFNKPNIAISLGHGFDRPVVDQTGLSGMYDFTLEWSPADAITGANGRVFPSDAGPHIQEAMKQQLGMKLVPAKALLDFLVVDHIERPSEN